MNLVHFVTLCCLLWCGGAVAGPLFKCELNGMIAFQDKPCPFAKQQMACANGDTPIVYSKDLAEPCKQLAPEADSYGYGGGGVDVPSAHRGGSYGGSARSGGLDVTVREYTRSNGTHVQGHTRSAPGRR